MNRGFDSFLGFFPGMLDYITFKYQNILDWHEDWTPRPPDSTEKYTTDVFADKAIEIIKSKAVTNDDTPFTITLSFNSPHIPVHQPPHNPSWRSILEQNRIFDAKLDTQRKDYLSMIAAVDERIGDIVDVLKTQSINGDSILDKLWLWFASDNGAGLNNDGSPYPFRGAKGNLFEGTADCIILK